MKGKVSVILALVSLCANTKIYPQFETMPITWSGKLITIEGIVNGTSGHLILDLGATDLVLNDRYYNGAEDDDYAAYGAIGKGKSVETGIATISLGGLTWKNYRATILSLAHLEKHSSRPILGLIGGRMLHHTILTINIRKMQLSLCLGQGQCIPEEASWSPFEPLIELPFRLKGGMPTIDLRLQDRKYRFGFDTAAATNMLSKRHLKYLVASMIQKKKITVRAVTGQTQLVTRAKVSGTQVEGLVCRPMKTVFMDMSAINQNQVGPSVDGILGFEFLRQFQITVDFNQKKMYLQPLHLDKSMLVVAEE